MSSTLNIYFHIIILSLIHLLYLSISIELSAIYSRDTFNYFSSHIFGVVLEVLFISPLPLQSFFLGSSTSHQKFSSHHQDTLVLWYFTCLLTFELTGEGKTEGEKIKKQANKTKKAFHLGRKTVWEWAKVSSHPLLCPASRQAMESQVRALLEGILPQKKFK